MADTGRRVMYGTMPSSPYFVGVELLAFAFGQHRYARPVIHEALPRYQVRTLAIEVEHRGWVPDHVADVDPRARNTS